MRLRRLVCPATGALLLALVAVLLSPHRKADATTHAVEAPLCDGCAQSPVGSTADGACRAKH